MAVVGAGQVVLVGPNGVLVAAGGLAQSGKQHEHLVDIAVAVPVVVPEVNILVGVGHGLGHHGAGP